jgi:hypothetical protein
VIARDTDAEAARVQMACWTQMGPAGRVALAFELSDETRAIALAGILARDPGLDERAARHRLARAICGAALADAAWPHDGADEA